MPPQNTPTNVTKKQPVARESKNVSTLESEVTNCKIADGIVSDNFKDQVFKNSINIV